MLAFTKHNLLLVATLAIVSSPYMAHATAIGSCYTDAKCSAGKTPISLDTGHPKNLGVACKSFYATATHGSICEGKMAGNRCGAKCQDLNTVNPCMKSGTTFLSFCDIAVNPPVEELGAREEGAAAI